jgi:hypothetical protein
MKSELAKRILAALAEDERTQEIAIDVMDNNGVVTLIGKAPSNEAKNHALEIAAQQPGVTSVSGDIKIKHMHDTLIGAVMDDDSDETSHQPNDDTVRTVPVAAALGAQQQGQI